MQNLFSLQWRFAFSLFLVFSNTLASPLTGMVELCLFGDSLDYSELTPSCQARPTTGGGSCQFNTCPVSVADFITSQDQLSAPQGVADLGFHQDTSCVDSISSISGTQFRGSVSLTQGHLYAIRTSEGNFAVLHLVFSGSGLPFRDFRWAYQPDGTMIFRAVRANNMRVAVAFQKDNAKGSLVAAYDLKGRRVGILSPGIAVGNRRQSGAGVVVRANGATSPRLIVEQFDGIAK